jgi:hypothetical protein
MRANRRGALAIGALLLSIMAEPGRVRAQFTQTEFRASDGTTYQVLSAAAPLGAGAERVRLTTVAGAAPGVGACSFSQSIPGGVAAAITGAASPQLPRPIAGIVRSGAFIPNDATVSFDATGGGRVTLGSGVGARNVCRLSTDCSADPNVQAIVPVESSALNVPAACLAIGASAGAGCDGPIVRNTLAFGTLATDFVCDDPTGVTANTALCAPEPTDGFTLQVGQAIVFIYDSSCDTGFAIGAAGFLIDADGLNPLGCAANQIVGVTAGVKAAPAPPPPCVPAPLVCQLKPREPCRVAGKSLVALKANSNNAKDSLSWQWDQGEATDLAAFGDPVNGTTDYAFCLYDTVPAIAAVPPALDMQLVVPAHGTCGANPCWKALSGGTGFQYTDGTAASDGVKSVFLEAGPAGAAKVTLKAGGVNLPLPAPANATNLIGENPKVVAQLVNREGECWQSVYLLPAVTSDLTQFKDKY